MRKLLAVALCALMVPALGHAGTRSNPEISDPAGDALPVVGAGYADLTQVWFTSVHDSDGALSAFKIHFGTAEAPGSTDEVEYQATWMLDAGQSQSCSGAVDVWRTIPKQTPYIESTANLTYSCTGDSNAISIGPLTVSVFLTPQQVSFESIGAETVVTIPLSALTSGVSAGLYRAGAKLTELGAQSEVVEQVAFVPADEAGCAGVIVTTDGSDPCFTGA